MYDFSVEVSVKAVERNRRILIEWSAYGAPSKYGLVKCLLVAGLQAGRTPVLGAKIEVEAQPLAELWAQFAAN